MTTSEEFLPLAEEFGRSGGGVVQACSEDGIPLLAPGTPFGLWRAVYLAEADGLPLVHIRFGPRPDEPAFPGDSYSTLTTDPWFQLPGGGDWVLPEVASDGSLVGWLRVTVTPTPPPITEDTTS